MAIRVRIRSRVSKPRRGFFTLTAEPRLKQDGPLRGYLDYVVFTACTTDGLQMWHADKSGNLITDFSALVPPLTAIEIVKELYLGRTVALPGRYRIENLRGRFGFPDTEKQG